MANMEAVKATTNVSTYINPHIISGPKPEYPNHIAYTAAYFSYGLYGWIEEWFARGMQELAEEMTILLKNRNLNS